MVSEMLVSLPPTLLKSNGFLGPGNRWYGWNLCCWLKFVVGWGPGAGWEPGTPGGSGWSVTSTAGSSLGAITVLVEDDGESSCSSSSAVPDEKHDYLDKFMSY